MATHPQSAFENILFLHFIRWGSWKIIMTISIFFPCNCLTENISEIKKFFWTTLMKNITALFSDIFYHKFFQKELQVWFFWVSAYLACFSEQNFILKNTSKYLAFKYSNYEMCLGTHCVILDSNHIWHSLKDLPGSRANAKSKHIF